MVRRSVVAVAVALCALVAAACATSTTPSGPRVVQPGAPGQPSRDVTTTAAAAAPTHTAADVAFMQGMIQHHAQAIEMTDLLQSRSERADMKLLAQRIAVSQADEIRMMRGWLEARGADVPAEHAHHAPGATLMPGMLTTDEMAALAAARGAEFDRLFLRLMIKHHEGALIMVKTLFDSPGAGQRSDIFAFASDVEADQSMEIERMGAMLAAMR